MEAKILNLIIANNGRLVNELSNSINNLSDFNRKELIKEFEAYVISNKRICINLNLESLEKVLKTGEYVNIFQLGYDTESIKSQYNNISPYYDKFERFVELFDGERIKYGSLFTGGLGSNYPGFGHGNLCLILKKEFPSQS